MRKMITACLMAGTLLVSAAGAQDLDELLASNAEARGGMETITGVESARITGTMMMGGQMEAPFTMEWKRPNMFRLEFTIQGQAGIQAYDGETAWMHMQFMGKADPEVMPAEQSQDIEEQADIIDGPFIDSEAKGFTVELVGKEEYQGTEAYRVQVTKKNGDVQYHFVDAEYFLTIGQESKRKMGETEATIETTYGDFKEIGGLVFPHYIESKPQGAPAGQTITIETVELGVAIDDERFVMPAVAPAAAEEGSEG